MGERAQEHSCGDGRRPLPDRGLSVLRSFDAMAGRDSPVHRLDPRAKILVTLAFIVVVMSFDRHELSPLVPLTLYPIGLFALSGLPARPLLVLTAIASPFALMVGIFNPLFDTQPMVSLFGVQISGGWISFASIVLRFVMTVTAALLLIATTGMYRTCMALQRLHVPPLFVLQLLFVYRYLFVLGEEAASISRAVRLRSFGRPTSIRLFGRLAGSLLIRTLDRAQRIHRAMLARGFDGSIRFLGTLRFRRSDTLFLLLSLAYFLSLRFFDAPALLGRLVLGGPS